MRAIRGDVPYFIAVDDCWKDNVIGIEIKKSVTKSVTNYILL